MMSRKHFQMIAEALKREKPAENWCANKHAQWELDVKAVAGALRLMNPRFDFNRFFKACGLDYEKVA